MCFRLRYRSIPPGIDPPGNLKQRSRRRPPHDLQPLHAITREQIVSPERGTGSLPPVVTTTGIVIEDKEDLGIEVSLLPKSAAGIIEVKKLMVRTRQAPRLAHPEGFGLEAAEVSGFEVGIAERDPWSVTPDFWVFDLGPA